MVQLTPEQLEVVEAVGWTEAEVMAFAQALISFRDGLPPRQRAAFTAMLAATSAAAIAASDDDVQGYLVVIAIIAILIGPLMPAVQKVWEAPSVQPGWSGRTTL